MTRKITNWQKILLAIALGILCGTLFGERVKGLDIVGTLFINIIKTAVIPLIFFTIIYGLTNVENNEDIAKIGKKSALIFIGTAMVAAMTGMVVTKVINPGHDPEKYVYKALVTSGWDGMIERKVDGKNKSLSTEGFQQKPQTDLKSNNLQGKGGEIGSFSVLDFFIGLIPSNFFLPFSQGNILQIIIIAFFMGVAINSQRHRFVNLIILIREITHLLINIIQKVMVIAPYAVFGYITALVGGEGVGVLSGLSKLVLCIFAGCTVQYLLFGIMIKLFARIKPWPFYRKIFPVQLLAFSTSSSKAALASMIDTAENKLGVSKESTMFVMPMAAALNMDGGAIYQSSCAIFFAQALGVELFFHDYILLALMATIASIGGAGIPGGVMMFLGMVLTSVGLPVEGVLLVATVDRVLDMITTAINVTGDMCVTVIIDKNKGSLKEELYYRNIAEK